MTSTRARLARLLATILVLTLVGPAFAECVDAATAAAMGHACCKDRLEPADAAGQADCCAISAPSSEGVPVESGVAPQPLRADHTVVTAEFVSSRISVPPVSATAPRYAPHVPLYIQQAAFLI